jgi:hypothetical protein
MVFSEWNNETIWLVAKSQKLPPMPTRDRLPEVDKPTTIWLKNSTANIVGFAH